jgi:hypothetical protein
MVATPPTPTVAKGLTIYYVAGTPAAPTGSSPSQILAEMRDAGGADISIVDEFVRWRGQEALASQSAQIARDIRLTLRGLTWNGALLDALGTSSSPGVMSTSGAETSGNRKILQSTLFTRGRFLLSWTRSDDGLGEQWYIPKGVIDSGIATAFALGDYSGTDMEIDCLYDATALYAIKHLLATELVA